MSNKKISNFSIRTDLIVEQEDSSIETNIEEENGIHIEKSSFYKHHCTTIYFKDITDHNHYYKVQNVFVKELRKYLKIKKNDKLLIIGLGNEKSTPDSLGPLTIEHILVTRYLYLLNKLENGYSNVASFSPNVMGNTGIETLDIIKTLVKEIDANKIIIIDALKTNSLERLGHIIQITDNGISPGSGIGNKRDEVSTDILNRDVIAIGVPTVVDLSSFIRNKKNMNFFMVTPTDIDFLIEKLSLLIGNGINISVHKAFIRQNNSS